MGGGYSRIMLNPALPKDDSALALSLNTLAKEADWTQVVALQSSGREEFVHLLTYKDVEMAVWLGVSQGEFVDQSIAEFDGTPDPVAGTWQGIAVQVRRAGDGFH